MEKYDLCIIGAGPSGYAAAMRSVDFGKKTLLIEKDKVGGAGLYNGALSSKTMWELSEKLRTVNERIKSVGGKTIDMSWEETQKTLMDATFDRKFQYSCHLKLLQSKALNNIFKYERGLGTFIDNHHIKIQKSNEDNKTIYAENIIIATGSKPRTIPNIDVDEKIIMTSDGVDHMKSFPKSMVIVGAGVIGCEYATIFSNFGKTKVYLIDRSDRILPFEDTDISDMISKNLKEKGVTIHNKAQLERLEDRVAGLDNILDTARPQDRNYIDRRQKEDRDEIANSIDIIIGDVVKLNEDKLPLQRLQLEQSAKIGPIKYVAEVIYGQEESVKYLDNAVRWVIYMLIFVFDPLAVLLLISSIGQVYREEEKTRPNITEKRYVLQVPKTRIKNMETINKPVNPNT